jgi:hypothetical protein
MFTLYDNRTLMSFHNSFDVIQANAKTLGIMEISGRDSIVLFKNTFIFPVWNPDSIIGDGNFNLMFQIPGFYPD